MPANSLLLAQRQSQTLSPRLQHAVRLLQMSSIDFAQSLSDVLGRNPFLESEETGDETLPGSLSALTDASLGDDMVPMEAPPSPTESAAHGDAEASGEVLQPQEQWTDGTPGRIPEGGDDLSALDLMPCTTSLREHLHSQLNVLPLEARDMALAKAVVESLDDDGYLRTDPFELLGTAALEPAASTEEVEIAVRRVQSLEPAGVGARSVQECLLRQLDAIDDELTRRLARDILHGHLKLLAARDVAGLAQRLRCTAAEAEQACQGIRRFDPRPGSRFAASPVQYVIPDVIARRHGRGWVATLNPAVVPRVRLNQSVVDLFQRHRGQPCPALAGHLQEARWTLRNVEQRFDTIVSVAQAIVDRQRHFLDYGELAMKPLGLREIAEAVGVHESTVSRVTNNKYIATPAGVFELKRFFSRAMVMASGASCSGTAIRGLVHDIIAAETPGRPLSDADITHLLGQQGLTVARRTVTKYRQALRIEPVGRRRSAA